MRVKSALKQLVRRNDLAASRYATLSGIHKRCGSYGPVSVEATPVVFRGRLLLISIERDGLRGSGIRVLDFVTGTVLREHPWDYGFGCAIVVDDTIHVFGTNDSSRPGNGIFRTTLDKAFNIGETLEVYRAHDDERIFNTSICASPNGYVLAFEFEQPGTVSFSARFLESVNLENWSSIGGVLHPNHYSACPTIRHVNGWFYIFHLRNHGKWFVTEVVRSRDLRAFDTPVNPVVIAPDDDEGVNASDLDLVEHNGIVLMSYGIGDQKSWGDTKTAVYIGTLSDLVQEFWSD